MPIRYERAYGGRDEQSDPDIPLHYPRNPMGTGVALRNDRDRVDGLALPNIEDPDDLLAPERVIMEAPERWPLSPCRRGSAGGSVTGIRGARCWACFRPFSSLEP